MTGSIHRNPLPILVPTLIPTGLAARGVKWECNHCQRVVPNSLGRAIYHIAGTAANEFRQQKHMGISACDQVSVVVGSPTAERCTPHTRHVLINVALCMIPGGLRGEDEGHPASEGRLHESSPRV
jgi:hypothetical protein